MAGASVIPLLSNWEDYISTNPEGDIPGFATWILEKQERPIPQPPPPSTTTTELNDTAQGALLIARLHRILRLFSKPILKDLGFTKDMEFAVLVQIAIMDKPNKKELGQELLIENSTGVEITKRLAKKGVIAETPDPNDRRSALLTVTEKGKKILLKSYDLMSRLHTSFLDALSPEEKRQFVNMLSRVNHYHTNQINNRPDFLE